MAERQKTLTTWRLDPTRPALRGTPRLGPNLRSGLLTTAALGLVTLGWSDDIAIERVTKRARDAQTMHAARRAPERPPITGRDLPDGVLALTWDDGPDAQTLDLARYLESQRVSGTFFVVREWSNETSEEPGVGEAIRDTGYARLPVLRDLVALRHRIGGHTENHVRLDDAADVTIAEQVGQVARDIDPFLTNELRMFRAPGGMWNREAAGALGDPFFGDIVGPIHWDIDGKDWESSLYCRAPSSMDCERGPIAGRTRVRPDVIARRYVALAERRRRGIVLMHDRVGDVGSHYSLDVARQLVPALAARGFVFAAPVLSFGTMSPRLALRSRTQDTGEPRFADVDGDGRNDMCRVEGGLLVCARAISVPGDHGIPHATFDAPRAVVRLPAPFHAVDLADIDGDHRADVCVLSDRELACATARADFRFDPFRRRGSDPTPFGTTVSSASFRLADVSGDGRADACARSPEGIVCTTSAADGAFASPRLWLAGTLPSDEEHLDLADVNGDGRADVCERRVDPGGRKPHRARIGCAVSNGQAFGAPTTWSASGDFASATDLHLADLNGDGRADLCAASEHGVACAFSNGQRFLSASVWTEARPSDLRFADLNGDGRADLCGVTGHSIDCAMAP